METFKDKPFHSLVALGSVPSGEMDRKELISVRLNCHVKNMCSGGGNLGST